MCKRPEPNAPSVWIFQPEHIRPGDILLSTTPAVSSRLIRLGTGGRFSHVSVCVAPPVFVEAVPGTGVRLFNVIGMGARRRERVCVRRLKVQNERLTSFAKTAHRYLARSYFIAGFKRFIPGHRAVPNPNDALFCSQLVATVYARAGIELVRGLAPDKIHPKHIEQSSCLRDVDEAVLQETAELPGMFSFVDEPRPLSTHDEEMEIERRISYAFIRLARSDPLLNHALKVFEDGLAEASSFEDGTESGGEVGYKLWQHPLHNMMYFLRMLSNQKEVEFKICAQKLDQFIAKLLDTEEYLQLPSRFMAEGRSKRAATPPAPVTFAERENMATLCRAQIRHIKQTLEEDRGWYETYKKWETDATLRSGQLFARTRLAGFEYYCSELQRFEALLELAES